MCISMFDVSASESRAPKTNRFVETTLYSGMEVGTYNYGLHVGLSRSSKGSDGVWVIVDKLTKSAHFLTVRASWSLDKLAELYVDRIVKLQGVPVSIVFDRDFQFVSKFWLSLHKALGTRLNFSTTFHPQTDGQSERTIQIL